MNNKDIFICSVVLLWVFYLCIAWYGDMRTCEAGGGEYVSGLLS